MLTVLHCAVVVTTCVNQQSQLLKSTDRLPLRGLKLFHPNSPDKVESVDKGLLTKVSNKCIHYLQTMISNSSKCSTSPTLCLQNWLALSSDVYDSMGREIFERIP